ncbi:hypothetical protein [Nocardia sp. NPDC050793]|uniref:hypothetical protein n=1 Tax=Nocardia sp. NPDC050793 TaxID=3155159 RepID=UPI0033C2033B
MPSFNEDVVIRGHDFILKNGSGREVARVDENGSLTMRREIAEAVVQVLQFASGSLVGIPITVLTVGESRAPAAFQVTGNINVRDGANKERIKLDGANGEIRVTDAAGNPRLNFDSRKAALSLGGGNVDGEFTVHNKRGDKKIELNGKTGDMTLDHADAAEDFEVENTAEVAAGMVMVLGEEGKLTPCSAAYDQKVVGVVSGAGRYRPGIVFDRGERSQGRRVPISVMGKVVCRADADYGRIRVGDLLTTSARPGCAMKAVDPARAFGTIIGKALGPLDAGEGLVPMLIGLQ